MSSPEHGPSALPVILAFALSQGVALAQGPLVNGENHSGLISSAGQLHEWTFAASAEQRHFRKHWRGAGGRGRPGIQSMDSPARARRRDLGSVQGALSAHINVTAPLTGTYTVVVASYTVATGAGEYLLTLAQSPGTFVVPAGDEGGPMTNGANHPGKIHRGRSGSVELYGRQGRRHFLEHRRGARGRGGPGIQSMDSPARARRRGLGLGPGRAGCRRST